MRELLQTAEEAARLGGQVLRSWANRFTVREKSRANLVTEADEASQRAIVDLIQRRFPNHAILAEEDLDHATTSPYRWIIDPLDGTSNYVHGFPYYAVSIGVEHEGDLVAGVIYDPTRDELFHAIRGEGAFLNRRPLSTSAVERVSDAMLIASLPVATNRDNPAVQRFLTMVERSQTVQRTGSAALNLANLAAGRIDGFWSTSLKPWDMAAGVVIVREAGGCITKIDGSEFSVNFPDLLGTNSLIHPEMVDSMKTPASK